MFQHSALTLVNMDPGYFLQALIYLNFTEKIEELYVFRRKLCSRDGNGRKKDRKKVKG
jgi:hypothetical protein